MIKKLHQQGLKFILLLCLLSVFSAQGSILSSSKTPADSIIRILAIGNSFSEDAMEHFLYGLANADGKKVIIGNLFIGASDLDLHWKNASENNAKYNYRKVNTRGEKTKTPGVAISTVLADEKWDYISFQQVSNKSGVYETYLTPLSNLLSYVKERSTNPNVKYVLHQTWAYVKASKNKKFETYNNSQDEMYSAIASTTKKIKKKYKFDVLIPAGTAIQNARTSFIGDKINRDDFHLSLYLGRYTASCAWYEMLFKKSVVGNTFHPKEISDYEAKMAQTAAHKACKKPYRVTRLKKFEHPEKP